MTVLVSPQTSAPAYIPRDYQIAMVEQARQRIRAGYRRIILQMPTGSGKTCVAATIIEGAVAKGKRICFGCHRRELVEQTSAKLESLGVSHGIVMANHWRHRPYAPCQVASIQSLVGRDLAYPPDILFFDECHHCRSKTWSSIMDRFPNAVVIGLTATPVRSDGKGLGNLFQTMVCGPSVAELTAGGYLVPTRVFAPNRPDLSQVKKTGGDYNTGGLRGVMDKPTITGDIVEHWRRLGENRQTIGFAVSVEHSQHLRDRFLEAGIAAAHLDGETPTDERARLLQAVASGEIRVLWSVGVLTEGWDSPSVSCAILARPTMSEGLYLQMAGRILRPAPGKIDALILDHAGCTLQHGFVDDEREWSLTRDRMRPSGLRIDTSLTVKACPKCFQVARRDTKLCACGYVFYFSDRTPQQVAGNLEEAGTDRKKYWSIPGPARRTLYMKWAREGAEKRYKPMFAEAKYRAMFGEAPKTEWMLAATLEVHRIQAETAVSGELRLPR